MTIYKIDSESLSLRVTEAWRSNFNQKYSEASNVEKELSWFLSLTHLYCYLPWCWSNPVYYSPRDTLVDVSSWNDWKKDCLSLYLFRFQWTVCKHSNIAPRLWHFSVQKQILFKQIINPCLYLNDTSLKMIKLKPSRFMNYVHF